jgi:hypothetical protein
VAEAVLAGLAAINDGSTMKTFATGITAESAMRIVSPAHAHCGRSLASPGGINFFMIEPVRPIATAVATADLLIAFRIARSCIH